MGSWSGGATREGRFQLNSNHTTSTMGDDAKLQEIQKLGGTAIKPVGWDRTGWEAFRYMLYNSIIGVNPGVGLRPRNTDARIDSQMFVLRQYDTNVHESEHDGEGDLNADYVSRTTKFLENYDNKNMGNGSSPYPVFDLAMLGECKEANNYGYVVQDKEPKDKVEPCIFIKLNTIWGWTPKPYDCAAEKEKGDKSEGPCLPEVEEHLKNQGADVNKNVYINCRGRYAADQEALDGGLTYFPANRGLPISYFPYMGKGPNANYHAPLVAVKISPKEGHGGQLIHIECRAYY